MAAHDCPTEIDSASSIDDVCEWLASALPESFEGRAAAIDAARRAQLDGRAFLALSEHELSARLGVSTFGVRRKLYLRVKDLKELAEPRVHPDSVRPTRLSRELRGELCEPARERPLLPERRDDDEASGAQPVGADDVHLGGGGLAAAERGQVRDGGRLQQVV